MGSPPMGWPADGDCLAACAGLLAPAEPVSKGVAPAAAALVLPPTSAWLPTSRPDHTERRVKRRGSYLSSRECWHLHPWWPSDHGLHGG